MLGYLVWNKAQCKGLDDEPNLGYVVFQTTDITGKDREAGFTSIQVGLNPAGYLHKVSSVFIDAEGWQLLLPDTRKMYKPVFW